MATLVAASPSIESALRNLASEGAVYRTVSDRRSACAGKRFRSERLGIRASFRSSARGAIRSISRQLRNRSLVEMDRRWAVSTGALRRHCRSMFLTVDEVEQLTGLRRPGAQHRWLLAHGFTAIRRADGKVLVARANVLKLMGGADRSGQHLPEPNWGALDS